MVKIPLPLQGVWVLTLVGEDPACHTNQPPKPQTKKQKTHKQNGYFFKKKKKKGSGVDTSKLGLSYLSGKPWHQAILSCTQSF